MIRDKFERLLNGELISLNTGEQVGYLKRLQKQYPTITDERIEKLPDADSLSITKDMKGDTFLILIKKDIHYRINIKNWKIYKAHSVSCIDTPREEKL